MAQADTEAQAKKLREALVRALLREGTLHRGRVERAFRRVPRHAFVPDVDLDFVYRDASIPTKLQGGEIVSSSSQPAIMAIMLEQLAPRPGQRVLEVGAGTGYNAALLADIVGTTGKVTSIDLDADTVERARDALRRVGFARVRVEQADGTGGFPEAAPYDRIIATVGLGEIPLALLEQLKTGGRIVMPLSLRGVMKSIALRKDRRGYLISTSLSPAGFMPMRGVAPLLVREVRLGTELGLYAWAAERDLDMDALYATLRSPDFQDVPTDLQLDRREVRGGLSLWLRGHFATFVQVHAEGALAESTHLPPFMRSLWVYPTLRDRVSIGLWHAGELALLCASAEQHETMQVGVRAWGGHRLAQQLVESVRAWRSTGSPGEEDLDVRLVPRGRRVRGATTIPMAAGTLELSWRMSGSKARR